jgi:hypothetical protein
MAFARLGIAAESGLSDPGPQIVLQRPVVRRIGPESFVLRNKVGLQHWR